MRNGEGVGKRRANCFIVFLWWQTADNAVEDRAEGADPALEPASPTYVSNVFPNMFRTRIFPHAGERGKKQVF